MRGLALQREPDVLVRLLQQRPEIFHFLREDPLAAVLPILRIGHVCSVSLKKCPIHRAPVVEPQSFHLDDLQACAIHFLLGSDFQSKLCRDRSGDNSLSGFIQLMSI